MPVHGDIVNLSRVGLLAGLHRARDTARQDRLAQKDQGQSQNREGA